MDIEKNKYTPSQQQLEIKYNTFKGQRRRKTSYFQCQQHIHQSYQKRDNKIGIKTERENITTKTWQRTKQTNSSLGFFHRMELLN